MPDLTLMDGVGSHISMCVPDVQVWCVVVLCFILGLPMLHSYVAFAAITSIGVIGLYISYLGTCVCG